MIERNGAQGRNRTTDTAIFSRGRPTGSACEFSELENREFANHPETALEIPRLPGEVANRAGRRKRHHGLPIPDLKGWNLHAFRHGVKVTKDPARCWNWTGAKADGYGRIKIRKRVYSAHRVAYVVAYGQIEDPDAVVMHTCDNRACCNPAHLRLGTPADNARDMVAKGRQYQPQPMRSPPRSWNAGRVA